MVTLVVALIIAAVIGICYYVPKEFNNFFRGKYGSEVISWPMAIISIAIFVFGALIDLNMEGLFWAFSVIAALFFIFSLCFCGYNAKNAGASVLEIAATVIMQILATASVVVFIILALRALNSLDKRRKRK